MRCEVPMKPECGLELGSPPPSRSPFAERGRLESRGLRRVGSLEGKATGRQSPAFDITKHANQRSATPSRNEAGEDARGGPKRLQKQTYRFIDNKRDSGFAFRNKATVGAHTVLEKKAAKFDRGMGSPRRLEKYTTSVDNKAHSGFGFVNKPTIPPSC